MMLLDLSLVVSMTLIIYTTGSFFITLFRPTLGLLTIIPIIILGFGNSSLIKGGFIAIITFAVLLHALITKVEFKINKQVIPVIIIVLSFILWIFFRNFLGDEGLAFWLFWAIKRLIIPGFLAFLVVFLIRTEKDILTFIYTIFAFLVITSIFGLLQYFTKSDIFWLAREMLGVPASIAYQIEGRLRITGLSSYVVPLSYGLLSILPIIFSLCFSQKISLAKTITKIGGAFIIALALALTFMKAAIAGAVLGLTVVIFLLIRSHLIKKEVLIFLLLIIFSFTVFVFSDKEISDRIFSLGQTSYERIPISIVALNVFSTYPLGVGYSYSERVQETYSDVSDFMGSRVVLVQFPHNMILDIGVILGLPALVIVFLFYLFLFKGLLMVYRYETENLKILAIGLIGSFVAYLFNAMFHNNNPFFGDTFNWLLIGVSLSLINIAHLKYSSRLDPLDN